MSYGDEQRRRVGALISASLAEFRATAPPRRHPANVTADRLGTALDTWPDAFGPEDRDDIARVISKLREIAGE